MSPLIRKSLAECETEALYRAWKGQLFIQDQRLCDVALRSPFCGSIPAQLPAKLEIKYVVGVSDLRKTLPEAVFGKTNYAKDEVCYQGMLFKLYEVESVNPEDQKVNHLMQRLKEKDLALVKYLNERGILVLLASSALSKGKDSGPDESQRLLALFLISSAKPMGLTAKDLKHDCGGHEKSLPVALALPGLRFALVEAAKHPSDEGAPPSTLVKWHIRDFAKLDPESLPATCRLDSSPASFDAYLKKSDLEAVSEKCPPNAFSRLQFYLSDPSTYTLDLSMATACFGDGSLSPPKSGRSGAMASSGLGSCSLPPGELPEPTRPRSAPQSDLGSKDAPVRAEPAGDRTLQWSKRKSSRLLVAGSRKKWAPMKVLCIMDSNKRRKGKRKKKSHCSGASSRHPSSPAGSEEPTLKLKNLQNPLKRKRGAEVLSAEFVQRTKVELGAKATSAPEGFDVERKKPHLLKRRKGPSAEKVKRKRSRCSVDEVPSGSWREAGHDDMPFPERTAPLSLVKDECDSHALNMLADLALSSSSSPLINHGNGAALSTGPSRERHRLQRGKVLLRSSDHEYHRVGKKWRSTVKRRPQPPGQCDPSVESPSGSLERRCVASGRRGSAKLSSTTSHAVLPKETEDASDSSTTSLISLEHSYAFTVPEFSKKAPLLQGVPGSPSSKNGVKDAKPGPLVGKVLPFRHQQTLGHPNKPFKSYVPFTRSAVMAARPKEDFSKSHRVTFGDQTVKVTYQWEAEYLFSLDSKYTNNSLEKTVIRAIHGPWDPSLTDDVEEMKLILHMWVALFYSKPLRSPTARKVVEHSNPAKYVSLNSVVDPLERIDDCEGSCSLERCPADSLSEANQPSSEAQERAWSPCEKPLSCNELSSTNCIEDEGPLVHPEGLSDLPLKGEQVNTAASKSEQTTCSPGKVAGEESEEEALINPITSANSLSCTNECSEGCSRPQAYKTGVEAEAKQAVNLPEVSQSNLVSVHAKGLETSTGKQPVTCPNAAISLKNPEIKDAPSCAEVENSHQTGGAKLLRTSEALWLEARAECREDDSLCREAAGLPGLPAEDVEEDGESMELGSIDLALSESNDADVEPRDVDLDQENEDLPEESCVAEEHETASPCDVPLSGDSLFALAVSSARASVAASKEVTELLAGRDNSGVLTRVSPSPRQTDLVEGFCILRENTTVDLVLPQANSVHETTLNEATELPRTEGSVESAKPPVSPNQIDLVEGSCISQGDTEISMAVAAPQWHQVHNDTVPQGALLESKEGSAVLAEHLTFPYPVDVFDVSCLPKESPGLELAALDSQHARPVGQTTPNEVIERPRNQEASEMSTKPPVSPTQMDLIEDASQESIHLTDSAPLQTGELFPVQNSMSARGESTGNEKDSGVLSRYLKPSESMDLVEDASVSQKEEGIYLAERAPSQARPDIRTIPDEVAKLPGGQGETAVPAQNVAPPEQMGSVDDSSIPQEGEGIHSLDPASLQATESHQVQNGVDTQEEEKARQMPDLLDVSPSKTDKQSFRLSHAESEANSENENCCVEEASAGNSSVTQKAASDDDRLNQAAVTLSDDIQSLLCELIDAVSVLGVNREETCSRENVDSNWMSSLTLESVTPPESDDEETCAADQLACVDPKLMANEGFKQHSISVDQKTDSKATLKGQHFYLSALHKSMENEPALGVLSSSSGIEQANTGSASLECKSQLSETATSLEDNDPTVPTLCHVNIGAAGHKTSISDGEDPFRKAGVEILPCVGADHQTESLVEESCSSNLEDAGASPKQGDPEDVLDDQLASERTQLLIGAMSAPVNLEDESFSADGDQEPVGDPYDRSQSGRSCMRSTESSGASGVSYVSVPEDIICPSGDWMYLKSKKQGSNVGFGDERHDWSFAFRKDDRSIPPSLDGDNELGPLNYVNFSVTKKYKEKARTFHSLKRRDGFVGELGLINSFNRSRTLLDDPIQNILDMECLRFHYKLKRTLASTKLQLSTSSDIFAKEFSPQPMAETLPLRKVPDAAAMSPPSRSRSPLLVTVVNPGPRHGASHWYPGSGRYSDSSEAPPPLAAAEDSLSKAARWTSRGQNLFVPFHLNKLTYNKKLKDVRGDISVIMDEFAELSRVMVMDERQMNVKGRDPNPTSEGAPEKRSSSLPRTAASYEHLFTELCNTLHLRLKNVAAEACQKPYLFYLVETEDDSFFGRLKNLLKKGGHTEAEPLHFLKASRPETDRLMVVIRNEDIDPHIHQIPCLMKLKHFPGVTFAGVDSPEDVLDQTYQELFHSGGFMVSDDQVLEAMTVGLLKDTIKALEKLNGHGRWRWLLHYKETKKLREDARVDSAAHAKDLILRSCQEANITEVLHYHHCDSGSSPRSEFLGCLLNLQIQHISRRFAVFLTEKSIASREALGSKGILALDVSTFIATAEDMATPLRSGY